jgi:hypothetical protein
MKYSVFLTQTVYVEVELEADDYQDAAERVALAAATEPDFLERHPEYLIDEIDCEVVTVADKTAVNADSITLADYNSKVVVFDADTVAKWLGELSPTCIQITEAGRRALEENE